MELSTRALKVASGGGSKTCKIYNIEFQTSCRPKYMAAGVQFPFRMNSKVRALYFLIFSRFNSMSNRLNFFFPVARAEITGGSEVTKMAEIMS